jgi:hypothetical protein
MESRAKSLFQGDLKETRVDIISVNLSAITSLGRLKSVCKLQNSHRILIMSILASELIEQNEMKPYKYHCASSETTFVT